MKYIPSFTLSNEILELYGQAKEIIGQFKSKSILDVSPTLRRENQILSIASTCAIEGNTLGKNIVTDIINQKRVVGDPREILEIKNAISLYTEKENMDYKSINDHLACHKILMNGLVQSPGVFRKTEVGVYEEKKLIHRAPPAKKVAVLMQSIFDWLAHDDAHDLMIKSAIFHYEFECIHPFEDGNGRLGRFWQSLMLIQYHPIFRSVPIESIVYDHQKLYYQALQKSQDKGDCAPFVEFSLFTIIRALKDVYAKIDSRNADQSRMLSFIESFKGESFSRADYMNYFTSISAPTASKDLKKAVDMKLLKKSGDKRTTFYRIINKEVR